jgi:hypothetical protein
MREALRMAVAAVALGTASVAWAGPAPHTHDGFYLNLELGVGGLSSSGSQAGVDAKLSGTAGVFGIALGGAVAPDFIIGGRFWGVGVSNPDFTVNGQKISTTNTSQSMGGLGLDLTYYVMPIGIYLQATPSIGVLSASDSAQTYGFDNGFAIRLAVGKEWWVAENWGLGFNVQYAHSSNKDKDLLTGATWGSNWFGVAFSATYN